MAIFLAVALGLTTILIGQMGIMKGMGDSVVAFYAADSGIEKILMIRGTLSDGDFIQYSLPNGATYEVTVTESAPGICNASTFCIKSIGAFRGTKRAIEITY